MKIIKVFIGIILFTFASVGYNWGHEVLKNRIIDDPIFRVEKELHDNNLTHPPQIKKDNNS